MTVFCDEEYLRRPAGALRSPILKRTSMQHIVVSMCVCEPAAALEIFYYGSRHVKAESQEDVKPMTFGR